MIILYVLLAWSKFFIIPEFKSDSIYFHKDLVYYGPEEAHWKATECSKSDIKCHNKHDDRVLTIAIMSGQIKICWNSTQPAMCASAVRMILGEMTITPSINLINK